MQYIAQAAIQMAADRGVHKVVSVTISVGQLRDFIPEFMVKCFNYCTNGTIAEGASLQIETIAVTLQCTDCSHVFEGEVRSQGKIQCPSCSGGKAIIKTGNELQIEGMEVS